MQPDSPTRVRRDRQACPAHRGGSRTPLASSRLGQRTGCPISVVSVGTRRLACHTDEVRIRGAVAVVIAGLMGSLAAVGQAGAAVSPDPLAVSASSIDVVGPSPLRRNAYVEPWEKWTDVVPLNIMPQNDRGGRHTLMVVPMDAVRIPPSELEKVEKYRKSVLAEVKRFWEEQIPGVTLRMVLRKAVKVDGSFCGNVSAAWALARREVPGFDPDRVRNHLAAVVECGNTVSGFGMATVSPGSGTLYSNVWMPDIIAHEFGHNMYLAHSNSPLCRKGVQPAPGRCKQRDYGDFTDIMGAANTPFSYGPWTGVYGLWRSMWVGAQRIATKGTSTVNLTAQRRGVAAPPALINSSIGPVFLDFQRRINDDDCPVNGVAMRVASVGDGAGQVLLPIQTPLTTVQTAGPLASFTVPGTKQRVFVASSSPTGAVVKVVPATNSRKPSPPAIPSNVNLPVVLDQDGWPLPVKYNLKLPAASGVEGYVVQRACPQAYVKSGTHRILIEGDENRNTTVTTSVRAVGTTGTYSDPATVSLTAVGLGMRIVDDGSDVVTWTIKSDFLPEWLTGYRVVYNGESAAELAGDVLTWDARNFLATTVPPDEQCVYVRIEAYQDDQRLDNASAYVCRA